MQLSISNYFISLKFSHQAIESFLSHIPLYAHIQGSHDTLDLCFKIKMCFFSLCLRLRCDFLTLCHHKCIYRRDIIEWDYEWLKSLCFSMLKWAHHEVDIDWWYVIKTK